MEEVTIHYPVQKQLGLTKSEYCVMDFIDHIVGDRSDPWSGFRQIEISQIARYVGLSPSWVQKVVQSLVEKQVLNRGIEVNSKRLLPTKKWYEAIKPYREKENG